MATPYTDRNIYTHAWFHSCLASDGWTQRYPSQSVTYNPIEDEPHDINSQHWELRWTAHHRTPARPLGRQFIKPYTSQARRTADYQTTVAADVRNPYVVCCQMHRRVRNTGITKPTGFYWFIDLRQRIQRAGNAGQHVLNFAAETSWSHKQQCVIDETPNKIPVNIGVSFRVNRLVMYIRHSPCTIISTQQHIWKGQCSFKGSTLQSASETPLRPTLRHFRTYLLIYLSLVFSMRYAQNTSYFQHSLHT